MKILNIKIIEKYLTYSFKYNKIPKKILKLLPKNWVDNNGNNLYHYAAIHHSIDLFHEAKLNNANINQRNNEEALAIHMLIASGFTRKIIIEKTLSSQIKDIKNQIKQWLLNLIDKVTVNVDNSHTPSTVLFNKIQKEVPTIMNIDFDIPLLTEFIQNVEDINAPLKDPLITNVFESHATNSRKNHKGSAIELLIYFFGENILRPTFDDLNLVEKYKEIYKLLSQAGSNINLINNSSEKIKDSTPDAMQDTNEYIVSHFFMKHVNNNNDFYALIPILEDPTLDFFLQDENGNTFMHHLFSRLNARQHVISFKMIELIFQTIWSNKGFNKECLDIQSNYRLKPINLLKGNAKEYIRLFDNYLLYAQLNERLSIKEDKIKRKNKI